MLNLDSWKTWTWHQRGRFNDWRHLTAQAITSIPDAPGVYLLAAPQGAVDARGFPVPRTIGRLLAEDPHGLLDVGEAASLKGRIAVLRECAVRPGAVGHMAGWRLGSLGLLRRLGCPAENLLISWYSVPTKTEAYEWEGWLLKNYFDLFGELPPLNYKFNWSAYAGVE